jgi:hypothetical protein
MYERCADCLKSIAWLMTVAIDILGHSQLATTSDLYGHIFPAAHRDATDLMDRILTADG